jgi:hypothetical protein
MTPKEKAEELINKFKNYAYTNVFSYREESNLHNSKQCALIAVDKILAAPVEDKTGEQQAIKYWTRVKKHIKEL